MYKGHYQPSSDCTATNVLVFSVRDNLQGIGLVVSLLYVLTTSETDIFTYYDWKYLHRRPLFAVGADLPGIKSSDNGGTFEEILKKPQKLLKQRWKVSTARKHRFLSCIVILFFVLTYIHSFILQVDMWLMKKDIYTDRNYWQHKLTQLITFDKPGLQHYLPVRVYCIVLCCAY